MALNTNLLIMSLVNYSVNIKISFTHTLSLIKITIHLVINVGSLSFPHTLTYWVVVLSSSFPLLVAESTSEGAVFLESLTCSTVNSEPFYLILKVLNNATFGWYHYQWLSQKSKKLIFFCRLLGSLGPTKKNYYTLFFFSVCVHTIHNNVTCW